MPRVLLLVPSTSYRATDFLAAARALGVEVAVGSDHRPALDSASRGRYLELDLGDVGGSVERIVRFAARWPLDAVLGTDDESAIAAAHAGTALGVRCNAPRAVEAARDKYLFGEQLRAAGLPSPPSRLHDLGGPPPDAGQPPGYPCVVKPRSLSGSRGVIRADGPAALRAACERVGAILGACARLAHPEHRHTVLVQAYVPGAEVALEGLLDDGRLHVLALIDKPEPMPGPYFAETLLTTPSRLAPAARRAVVETVAAAARAIGLRHGPVHAELRVSPDRGAPWLIEIAPRTIGGLCSRALRFAGGERLETLALRQALGLALPAYTGAEGASGVMMIPVPRAGRLGVVGGVESARRVDGVEDVVVSIAPGDRVTPLPEADRYLGFIFARAPTPQAVEDALREAHACLEVEIETLARA